MVDKVFLIDQLCLEYHVEMVRPPFLRKKKQLSKHDEEKNRSIATARVHVEHAIQRMKQYKILTGNLGIELFPSLHQWHIASYRWDCKPLQAYIHQRQLLGTAHGRVN